MDVEGFAGRGMTLDRLGDLDHPAGFRQIEGTRRKEQGLSWHHIVREEPR